MKSVSGLFIRWILSLFALLLLVQCGGDVRNPLVGATAPRFALEGLHQGEVRPYRLEDYRGHWVILFFYPADLTYICPLEIYELKSKLDRFPEDSILFGISRDSIETHREWIRTDFKGELDFPLLADVKGTVAKAYGVMNPMDGLAFRATFIIDPMGKVQYHLVHNMETGRSTEELLRVLEALRLGDFIPPDWHPGDATLGTKPSRAQISNLLESATE